MVTLTIKKAEHCFGEYSIFAAFSYSSELVALFKEFPNRWYHPKTKEWEIPYDQLPILERKLAGIKYRIIKEVDTTVTKIPIEYEFKTKPFEHQLQAINFGLSHNNWLLGDSMGLGKTKVAIDIACIKKQQSNYQHCLIICGVNSLKWNWVNEIKTHSNEGAHILGQRVHNGSIQTGNNKDKIADIKQIEAIRDYFLITNIESLRSEELVTELKKTLSEKKINMIVLDEAHVCKNPSSQQGKGMLKLSADTMLAMTGTPLMNNPIDLYFILKWLGYERHNLYTFKNYYCIFGGYGGHEIVGYRNLAQLQSQLQGIMLRRLKEDVFDLPEKIYVNEYVELTPKQRQIYNEVRQTIQMNIDKIVTSPNPLAEFTRMRQATGYPGILSSSVTESAKLDRLEELVAEAISNNQKVVIFSNWTQITNAINQRLQRAGYLTCTITGETADAQRQQFVNTFQNNPDYKIIIGTIGAMGTGITLTAGTVEIFMDEPWNKALKEQAVDRCHRIGTKSNVTIYTLMAKNTIDERIHMLVQEKGELSDLLVDGKLDMSRKDLVNYLLG